MDEQCPESSWHLAHRAKIQRLIESTYGPLLAHTCVRPFRIRRNQVQLTSGGDETELTRIEPHVWQSKWKEPPRTRVRISTFCQCLNIVLDIWPNEEGTVVLRDNLAEEMVRERSMQLGFQAA